MEIVATAFTQLLWKFATSNLKFSHNIICGRTDVFRYLLENLHGQIITWKGRSFVSRSHFNKPPTFSPLNRTKNPKCAFNGHNGIENNVWMAVVSNNFRHNEVRLSQKGRATFFPWFALFAFPRKRASNFLIRYWLGRIKRLFPCRSDAQLL